MAIFFALVALFFLCLWLKTKKDLKSKNDENAISMAAAQQRISKLDQEIATLSKYRKIVDIDAECKRLKDDADNVAESTRAQARLEVELLKRNAEKEANELKQAARAARDAANAAKSKAETEATRTVSLAEVQAKTIISDAESKAKEIAGSAYEAKEKADQYQEIVVSLKNIINGYGDEWLKPTYSLLDELAEDFGFTEAGEKLKDARAKSALMVKSGVAGICDYVQENRRSTAVNFVIDAFNGKVDSILSKTKKDNFGKLERQIIDAFNLVNMNGSAFRNAKISDDYLAARLDELKWAVICQELKAKQQEEQRRIREQMREEEKARREYERAQKEAAKEEAMLRKAMEKAQAAMEKASAEQKAQFEAQLADLQQKLVEAEEKNQRALSMAQQTKRGNVYVISNIGSFGENVYKVGMTRRLEPLERVKELGDASVPFPFDVHAIIESDDAPALETALHKSLALMQVNKVNPRKEFFRVNLTDIRALVDHMGLKANWTLEAEAAEYRETMAIETRMKTDPDAKRRWEEYFAAVSAEVSQEEQVEN